MLYEQVFLDVTCALEVTVVRSNDPYFTPSNPPPAWGDTDAHQKLF